MIVEKGKTRWNGALISLAVLLLLLSSTYFSVQPNGTSGPLIHGQKARSNYGMLSFQQPQQSNQSDSIELGFGPSSLVPITQQTPVYTVNDELWIESNYNTTIQATLSGANSTLQTSTLLPNTITDMYSFASNLATQTLTLSVQSCSGQNSTNICLGFSFPIQFVNPLNDSISSLSSRYSISNSTLTVSLSSKDLDNKFDIQQCLSSVSTKNEVEIPVPSPFGGGFIGIIGNPSNVSATIVLNGAIPSSPFAFSFELLGNYTSALATPQGVGGINYVSSVLQTVQSDSVLVAKGGEPNFTETLSELTPLRSGSYVLRASFENSNGFQVVDTPVLIESPSSSSWFWLGGACLEFNEISPTFTSEISLSGSPNEWPRYLYLLYQTPPGIAGYTEVPLDLSLDRVRFVVGNNNNTLPSSIGVSLIRNTSDPLPIEDAVINEGGVAYVITNGTYPVLTEFDLSFGGTTFARSGVILQSPYSEVLENIKLASVEIIATQNGRGVPNATVTIHSNTLNSTVVLLTNGNGIVQTFVPPGNYLIYVKSGSLTEPPFENSFVAGSTYSFPVLFPGPVNYTSYLAYLLVAITVIGVIGNLWFWLAKRRIRSNLR